MNRTLWKSGSCITRHGVGAEGGVLQRGKWQQQEEALKTGFTSRKRSNLQMTVLRKITHSGNKTMGWVMCQILLQVLGVRQKKQSKDSFFQQLKFQQGNRNMYIGSIKDPQVTYPNKSHIVFFSRFFGRSASCMITGSQVCPQFPWLLLRFSLSFLWLPQRRTHLNCISLSTVISRKSLAE